jgi:hypothetical protein
MTISGGESHDARQLLAHCIQCFLGRGGIHLVRRVHAIRHNAWLLEPCGSMRSEQGRQRSEGEDEKDARGGRNQKDPERADQHDAAQSTRSP